MSATTGIAAFDLDGTLLRGATVCELLAVPCDRVAEVRAFECSSGQAEIRAGRVAMARWYEGVPRERLLSALESAEWAPGATQAVSRLRRHGVEVVIASITWSFAVEWFARRLGVSRCLGTDLLPDGSVQDVWPRDKGRWLAEQATDFGVKPERVAAVGDSGGDVELLQTAAVRIFVGSALPPGLDRVHHLPGAHLEVAAQVILDAWGSPGSA
jgi:HAD superfamily phosphoserine phosphatase-like hydrolase